MNLLRALIFAKDMPRMTAFYRDALELRTLTQTSGYDWVEFDAGGLTLTLHAIPSALAQSIEITAPPTARSSTPIKLIFQVADLEQARERLLRHGAVVYDAKPWGACDALDPEGNVFQIASS